MGEVSCQIFSALQGCSESRYLSKWQEIYHEYDDYDDHYMMIMMMMGDDYDAYE